MVGWLWCKRTANVCTFLCHGAPSQVDSVHPWRSHVADSDMQTVKPSADSGPEVMHQTVATSGHVRETHLLTPTCFRRAVLDGQCTAACAASRQTCDPAFAATIASVTTGLFARPGSVRLHLLQAQYGHASEQDRRLAICTWTFLSEEAEVFVVEDARQDPRSGSIAFN